MALDIRTAPPGSGEVVLGKTLPALLDEAVERYPNPKAFNQPKPEADGGGWTTMSNGAFRTAADEVAAGLRAAGLQRGDHLAFFMNSDVYFALADVGCLISGVISVPLYTTFARETLVYVTRHSEAKALFVSNPEMLAQAAGWVGETGVRLLILAEGDLKGAALPDGVRAVTLDALRGAGRDQITANPGLPQQMRGEVGAQDLATLIYTSGTTGQPKGVMLTHENISSNLIAAFDAVAILGHQEEVVLTFLPMTHVLARTLQFAHVAWGHQLYYSNPDQLVGHLAEVRPTIFATVPRVLEKVYDKVLLGIRGGSGAKKAIGGWALGLARDYDLAKPGGGQPGWKHALADKLVYSKLRERLGLVRVKAAAVGGAALRADLANTFNAFGIPVLQGYGLTECPVLTVNLPRLNRAGTVGPLVPGTEIAIAEDGEILARGPQIMKGYYKAPEATAEVMDAEGWFHTGDIGEFTAEGCLKITDRKKALFKLSTGKYVIPQPIENALTEDPLIEQAVVVGADQKFCSALIFPNMEALRGWAEDKGLETSGSDAALLARTEVQEKFEALVAEANAGKDPWSQIKRFHLVPETMTIENDLLTPTMKVKRSAVNRNYGSQIEQMYEAAEAEKAVAAV
jgi:long-chain acyl-CoA synthetase